ncbi:dTDP-4-dehydrorhamnose reductase [Aquipuribacter nitratireducens]|uniref:dTDP-4-dehydrorhamnose reductase n=1 Tax=Aquipuribacter nitratireducens TaxID=650104 RepID=A0ABW0GKI1_9MICO
MSGPRRWLVTGAAGTVGSRVVERLLADGEDVTAATRAHLDVTDQEAVDAAVEGHDVVVNAAAWTAVDDAETHEAEAFAANAVGPALLAVACARRGVPLLHLSTDYVFDGQADRPFPEDAPLRPRSAYGRTKAAGEWAVRAAGGPLWLLRTAWVYDVDRPCFPRTVVRLLGERESLDVVDDQVGQPTWARDVADLAVAVVRAGAPHGTYHATAAGQVSWFGLTRALLAHLGEDPGRVRATTSEAFRRPAPRPAWSVLGHAAWQNSGVTAPRAWEAALAEAVGAGLLR